MIVAGTDEAGRGCLAGPVVGAAVILPPDYQNSKIKDSKKLNKTQRQALYHEIIGVAQYSIIEICNREIDEINILRAALKAMCIASEKLAPDLILVDGNQKLPTKIKQKTIVGGDDLELCISAASILAKVHRDTLMEGYDKIYPQYGFKSHMGYATKMHYQAIRAHGTTPIHRLSFRGVL